MVWGQLEPTKAHVAYACIGVFSSIFSLVSLFIKERLYIGESMVAGAFGLIVGPHCLDWFNPISWGDTDAITLEITRIVLCLQVFAVAVELPRKYMWKHWLSVTMLLVPVMTFGWLIIGLFVWIVIPGLNFSHSLLVAACITATDPILAQSVVSGKFAERVPGHLRNLLSAESGCNDGLAFPFIYLSLYLIMHPRQGGEIVKDWICITILWECLFGCLLGCVIGYCGRRAIRFAEEKKIIDRESFLAFYVVLTFMCAGFGSILGVDDLLTSFSAGAAFAWDGWFSERTKESNVSTVIDVLLNYAYFVYFGAIIPWQHFNDPVIGLDIWRLIILAIIVIFLRRIPAVLLLKPLIPDIKSWREAVFVGHFGPIGVGAVFASLTARAQLETQAEPHEETPLEILPEKGSKHWQIIWVIWPITCFFILTSIIVHGSSVAIITLGRHLNTITLTKTFTTNTTNGNGKSSWMQRLPALEKSGRSFSLQRVDTEAPSFSGQTAVETSGVPYTPAGGMKRGRKNRRNKRRKELLHVLSGNGTNEEELNDLGRERLQREKEARAATFALSTAANRGTNKDTLEAEGQTPGGSDSTEQVASNEPTKSDIDIMNREETVHAISGLDELARDREHGEINLIEGGGEEEDLGAISTPRSQTTEDIDEKLSRRESETGSRRSAESERMRKIREEEEQAHVAYAEDDQLIVENAEGEVIDEARYNKPRKDEEHGLHPHHHAQHENDGESPIIRSDSNRSGHSSLSSLKRVLSPKFEGKLQDKMRRSSSYRRANKYYAYKIDNQLIIEDKEGEVLRRYKINTHTSGNDKKKPEEKSGTAGGKVMNKALSAVGIKNRSAPNNPEGNVSPTRGEENLKMVRNPTPAPKDSYRRPEELENDEQGDTDDYEDEGEDSNDEDNRDSYDDNYTDDSEEDGEERDNVDGDSTSVRSNESETAVERERRLNALGHFSAPRDQDDEEEPPTPLEAQAQSGAKNSTTKKVKDSLGRKFHLK
ncbi:ZYRO0F13816p [Zygosaccharomyces rouxii]|uniref:ZYRO0F13816p n=1 Tax=Zygosaccharomyces rouxii (strain ATCC 2623 / CBS 732 / NBRC 1130 / NCYC 568 / NRRL Y-229) TaxID=559307 RepID=C5DYK7_ZYGRC|nr:uncharacterized protein ZYRO0F13816g [Zygosaccharomyces rouxii]KAH9199625.1 alkali metal cation/H+ antiporter Nha1 C terminus-domain-containing protein [Zygosaccharomyces rouxii]CAR28868.1 ZYRO0F13816p [Zygosaccharomyces rouxii]